MRKDAKRIRKMFDKHEEGEERMHEGVDEGKLIKQEEEETILNKMKEEEQM